MQTCCCSETDTPEEIHYSVVFTNVKSSQCFSKGLVTTLSAVPHTAERAAESLQSMATSCPFTDCMTQAKGIGGSTEVIQITSFLSFEQPVIMKLNHNSLHANKNVVLEMNNSKLVCLSSFNIKAEIQFSLLCVFSFRGQWETAICENSCE